MAIFSHSFMHRNFSRMDFKMDYSYSSYYFIYNELL